MPNRISLSKANSEYVELAKKLIQAEFDRRTAPRKCILCRVEFRPQNINHLFCSSAHRVEFFRLKKIITDIQSEPTDGFDLRLFQLLGEVEKFIHKHMKIIGQPNNMRDVKTLLWIIDKISERNLKRYRPTTTPDGEGNGHDKDQETKEANAWKPQSLAQDQGP